MEEAHIGRESESEKKRVPRATVAEERSWRFSEDLGKVEFGAGWELNPRRVSRDQLRNIR